MWELVKRSLQRERTMTAAQLGRPRRASVQRMHNEIVEAFLKAGRQRVRRSATGRLGSVDSVVSDGVGGRVPRSVRGGLWRAFSSLGLAIAMAIRLLNPYVLISVALGQRQSLLAHLSARVDSMRAVLSPRIGRRRRLTAWVQDTLPQRRVSEAASAVWQDGSLLCGIVEAAVPGSCPGYDSLTPPNADRGATLWLGQKLASRYLGVPPAFSDEEFSIPHLTIHMERRMLRYLSALKTASARVEAERRRRQAALESSGASVLQEDAFSLDTIANSSLPPGESLLECVARGMGLILGVQGRKSTFYLYLNPNHPHRHIHRLMRSSTLERQPSFDEEAGAILMQIRGPEGDFGATLLSTAPGSSSTTLGTSLEIMNENWFGRIPIRYETTEESVMVSYVPQTSGRHELILLQRGGSHVPGSPFSITVEESSDVPDDNGKLRRFGSEPVDGLLPPPKYLMTKATSYESGLNKGHRRLGSGGSDPGTRSEGDYPGESLGVGKRRRVVARVVDFVTEKMLLTEDGKLERLPKRRKVGRQERSGEKMGLLSEDDETIDVSSGRRYSTLYTSLSRVKHLEVDEPIHGTYPGRRSPVDFGKSETTYGISKSGLEMDTVSDGYSSRVYKGKRRGSEKQVRVSEIASHGQKESLDSINFREHCRRILWLCDILLKHSPRQESLEILNTAGDILDGKRVHPTIMEESEPEDTSNATPPQSVTMPSPAEPRDSIQSSTPQAHELRVTVSPPVTKSLAQRLQREPSDTGGLNEVSAWKDGRRQFHSWTRKEKDGGGIVGGRLIHKGGSYRGVVVRDMTPEALSGAYTGGDELTEDEVSQKIGFDDEDLTEEDFPFEAASGMARHSLPKIRPPSLGKQMECRRASVETPKQRSSASDRGTDGGPAVVIGKRLNKSNASDVRGQINCSGRGLGPACGAIVEKDRLTGMKVSTLRNGGGTEDHQRCHSKTEDKSSSSVARKNVVLAAAVALAEGEIKGLEGEPWEEPLSDIGTAANPEKEEKNEECDKTIMDPSSKGEPPPVQQHKEGKEEVHEGAGGEEAAACGAEDEEEEEKQESGEPPTVETESLTAREINERSPTPSGEMPTRTPSPPIHSASAEKSPGCREEEVSRISREKTGSVTTESEHPQTTSKKDEKKEESVAVREVEEKKRKNEGGECERHERLDKCVEMKTDEKKREEQIVNNEGFDVVKSDDERIHPETPGMEKEETDQMKKIDSEFCVEEKDRDREGSRLQTELEIKQNLEEGSDQKILLATKETLKLGDDKNADNLEEIGAAVEEEIKENVETFGQGKGKSEEKSLEIGEENGEDRSEKFMKEKKEIESIEESLRVREDKGQISLGSESNALEDAKSQEESEILEEAKDSLQESNFTHDSENSGRNETKRVEISVFEGDDQLVVTTEETYSVKETVVGNEDQPLQSEMVIAEESGTIELHPELEIEVTELDREENEEVAVEKVEIHKIVDGERYEPSDTRISENGGKLIEGQECNQHLKDHDEHYLIPEKSTEAEKLVSDKYQNENILRDDWGISLSEKEKRANHSDGCKNINENIATAETQVDEITQAGERERGETDAIGDRSSSNREESSQQAETTKEIERSQDANPNVFSFDQDKKFMIGSFHEVLKLEDAFFTSAIGIQNTKECGNAHAIPGDANRSLPRGDEGADEKIDENIVKIEQHVGQEKESETNEGLEGAALIKENPSEETELSETIKKCEPETKDELSLGFEETSKGKVGANSIKECSEINDADKKPLQMQDNKEATILCPRNENHAVGNKSSSEFSKFDRTSIKEPKDYFNAFVEETQTSGKGDTDIRLSTGVDIEDLRLNDDAKGKKDDTLPEIEETRSLSSKYEDISRKVMNEIVSKDCEKSKVEEIPGMKEETTPKVEIASKTLTSSSCTEEFMDNLKETAKIDSEKEKSASEKFVTQGGEVGLKEVVETEVEAVIGPDDDTVTTSKNRVNDNSSEEGRRELIGQRKEILDDEKIEVALKEKNEVLDFGHNQTKNMMAEEGDQFRHVDILLGNNSQNRPKNKDMGNGRVVEGNINLDNMTENTLNRKLWDGEEVEVKCEETAFEKILNAEESVQGKGREHEDKIGHTITRDNSPQSVNKPDIDQNFAETKEVQEGAADVKEKDSLQPSSAHVDDKRTIVEKPQGRNLTEEDMGKISSTINEIKDHKEEAKLCVSIEEQPPKGEEDFKQLYPDMKDEQVTVKERTQSLNEISCDTVRATESNANTDEGKETVRKGTEELEKSLEIKSLEIQTMMESVKTAILERTAVDSLIDFDIQTCEYTLGKVEMSVEKSKKNYFNERKEAEECKFTETNPFAEFNETNEPEKEPTEILHENDAADGVKKCKLSRGEPYSAADGAEEAEVRKDEEGGHEIEGAQKENDEGGGDAPLGEGTQKKEEEPSKEETAPLNEEESKENRTGAEAKTPTYGEIVGRILCTDSFPSESLEWFEEEGKKGEAVEGTLESMVEAGGRAEAVEAGTAVGDEVWELPETAREEEQSPDIAEAERHEGLRTHREGEVEGVEKICEETIEGAEIEDDDQWTSGTQSNLEEDEEDAGQEGTTRGGGGSSLRVGVGVVVAGGIVSRDSSRRDGSEGRDAAWRRSKWRASRSKSIEEGLPLPKEDPVGKEWEEICMGIDAMEDGSISQVIAEVSGKRRRRRTRKERGDRSGKAMRTGYGRWAKDGTEATKEPPIPESQTPEEEAAEAQRLTQLPSKVGVGLTTAGVIGEEEEKKEEMETSEGTGASREESPRVGMFGDPRWYSSSSWSSSLGGAKVEELRVDWVGAMEEGKRGRGPAEEEGVEAREEAGVEEASERAEEGEDSKIFLGDKGVSFTEMTPAEVSRIKGYSAKDLEVPVVTPNRGIRLEEMAGGKSRGEKTDTEAIEERKSSHVHDASSSNEEGLREADKEKEGKVHKRRNAENLEVTYKKNVREGDEEGEEMEEEEEEEVGGKVTDEVVSSHVTGEDLKETAGVESENTELGNIPTGEESEENQWDGERRNSKSMYPPEDDVSSKFENKYSQEEKESIFGRRGSDKGKLTEAQSSGEWEFVDTGRHFAGNENSEDETFNEYEGRFPRDNFDGDSKGSFLHSLVGNRDSNQPLGVVGMGIELLHSLVDIPNREETVSTDGASPKREGEELFGVRMTLDDWDGRRGPNYSGSKAEVVVGELDLLDDWDHGVGRIGFIEIATDEHQENHLKDDYGVKMQIIEMEKEKCVEEMGEKDGDQGEINHVEGKSESTVIFTEKEVIAEDRESDVKQEKRGGDENHESTDDDDIEEIVRTDPDDWNRGTFTFTDSDHRSAFRNFEDLLGGDVSFKMTTCTAQFNLWPSEEAFGGKGTWMEHIDMDAFMSTAQSQQKPCSGKGLLEGMTTFAKTCVVGDEKGSTTTREQYYFTDDDEGGEMRKEILADGDEDDVVLVEQDFDDRSDEIEDNVGSASPWKSTYQSFDFSNMSHVRKGDAFAIFESPGVTTRATQDYEQLSDDEVADDESGKNWSRATLSGCEEMEMLDLSGDWEESVVFVDDDDGKSIPIGGRRGSGEYRKFENEIEGRVDSDLWGAMTLSNVDSCAGDTAFAIVMDSEEMKEKTPVLPTGRWCPRLPLLSPAMSAISEEESEEIYPEKYEKQDEESGSFQTDNEWDNQSSQDKAITREADDENLPDNTVLWEPSRESEGRGSGLENVTGGNEIQPTAIYTINLTPDETDTRSSPDENLEQGDAKHQLPKLDVEVEDGFGEPFSRRKSSSSSVLSETTTVEPMADCGAAFVVSSELAVALALGVSITQIIPPTMDQPEPPPLPQVELGTDALRAGHAREKERLEVRKSSISSTMNNTHVAQSNLSDEEQRTYSNEIVITTSDNSVSLKDIQSSTVSTKENNLGRKDDVDFLFPERNVSWYNEDDEEIFDWWRNQRLMTETFPVKEEVVDDKTELVTQEQPSENKEKYINTSVDNSINFLYPERNVSWYNDDEEEVVHWCYKERMATVKLSEEKETGREKREPTDLPTTDIKEEINMAEKESIDFLFPERNVSWYNDDEEEVVHWCYKERMATVKLSEEKETGREKREPTDLPTTDIEEEINMAEKESIDFLFPERNVSWYNDDEEEVVHWCYKERMATVKLSEEKETGREKREPTDLPTTDIEEEINMAEKESIDFLFPERNVSWYNDDEEEVVHWCYKERMATMKLSEEKETGCEKREPTGLPTTDIKEEINMAEKESIDFLFPERNVSWYNDDEEEVVHWCYKERMATVKLSEEKETGREKREPTDLPITDIKEEINMAEKESIDFLFPERNVNWYDEDQEDFHNWSYMRPQTGTVVEEEKKEVKTTEEEKIIAFLDKERGNEKGRSAAPDEEVLAEPGKKRRPLESKGKVSPPSGARKKESPDKKTRDSPARPIPLEKLLGWPSESGNGNNGIGCSGIASRRESVFDDYNFSLWENEFKLNKNDGKERGSKRQDSTGLEYYLDVDQLLNVPLAATEPEVKYVSAKEIMDTFNREMDSPEKSSDKESESKGEKASKSDSLDDSLLGAVGGASIAPIDEALVEEATGSSQTVIETKNKGPDLWADDLFTDAFQSKARMGSKFEPMNAPWVITEQRPMKSIASQEVCCKAAMSVSKPEEDIKLENTSCVKAEETCTLGNEIEEVKKDAVMSAGMGEGIEIKSTDGESVGDQKQYGAISKKGCDADAKNRRFSSGGKVRNMIGIFEQQPGVTKSPARKELASHKDGDIEKRPETMFQEIRSADIKCMHGKLGDTEEGKVRLEIKEPMKMLSEETLKETTLAMSRSVDNSAGERGVAEAEAVRSTQLESSSIEKVAESSAAEQRKVQKEQLIDLEEAQRTEKRPPTLEDKRDDILSLTEEPVVGWEAIKVATEVENIILSTGNAVEQKRNLMGDVIILAEPDKKSGESGAHAKTRAKTSESEVRRKEAERASYSSTKGSGSTDRVEEHLPEWEKLLDRSEIKEEPLTSRMERMSTSSSFEEYKSVVSEAYQFLEALGDTIDEDDEDKDALPGEEAKETGGKAEESVGGLGSEVEEYHPCEELPGGERETIPRGVEGAPTKGGQAEAQSSPSSPERCKTTESSTSSSPYSSLPTFADISSGILSSASSKDENSLKTEDGPSRRERTTHKTKDTRGYPKAEADGTTDGTPAAAGDILEEEMDSTTLAKMNVASRKEYWDRRLKRAQEKSKEPVTVGSKPSPLTLSGIVARGRMSFEKSKDEYSTSDSGGDGGKSSSESSPTSKGNQFSRRPKAVYSKGARSIFPPKPVAKEPLELTLPYEEKEAARPMEGQSSESVARVSNQDIPKEIRIPSGQEKSENSRNLDDKEDLSQISVSKRREIWNQKVQKIPEDDSPPSSIEYRRTERRKSSKLESVEAISAETPLRRRRSDLPPYTRELEEQSLSLDSSSVDDRVGKDLGIKKPPAIKTGGSVSQLAKLFSSPPPEPPPVKSRGIRPMSKVKYSRGPEAGSLSSKDESVDEPRGSAESSSSAASPKAKAIVKPATVEASITGSRSPSPGESLAKKITSDDRSVKKFSEDLRKTSYSPTSKSPRGVLDRSTFRTDSESSEIDNIASRRQKYLESVQQSLEGDDGRYEGALKKSESEDSMKEHMRKKAVSEVRNIWEKRASLDGSSSSESMKRPGKVGTILRSPISNKKKVAQEESLAAMTNVGQSERVRVTPLKGVSTVAGIEGKVDISLDMSVAQNKAASSAVPPSVAIEKGHSEGDHSTHIALRRKEAPMDAEKDSEPQIPLSTESAGGIVAGLSVQSSVLLHEERPSLKNEGKQVQGENTTAQLIQGKIENKIHSHDLSSEKMAEGSDQSGSLVARVETASEIKFEARGSTPQEKPKSPYGRGFTQQREGAARTEAKVPGDSTAQSTLKGRRHSCATVFSPPNKVDLSKTREKFGSVEEKMLEFQGHKVKRDSLEIRVTDDEDVCVMREVTSVPRFALKEKKMETHAEEDVDERQAGGRKAEGKVDDEEDGHKTPSPTAKGATKRRSLPQRTLSIQVSGIVASGRRRFESGKAVAEDMPTLAEEIAETANKSNNPATGRSSEERKEIPCVEGAVKEQDEDRGRRGGTQDQEDGPKITGSNGRELYRAVPASVTVVGEHRVIGKEAVRSEARLSLEKTSPASRGGEGGDDGRSATTRRVSKGKAPPPARQPPPSAASSPDSESEGAAEAKLLGFLSTPAAQARRHSAVDVASLRSFTGGDAAGAPRMRRRGSGDLGSPSRLKNEDESKKRFTRARQFFETLERGNDSPPSPPQSAAEVSSSSATPLKAKDGKKKKSSREERTPMGTSSLGRRTGGTKYRPPVPRQAKDSSGSTTDSDKERKHRRKVRRTPSTHSAPGSDVDNSGSTPLNHPSLHRRKREREFVLRSQRFGGSEREVKVSERFNVMDLFRDVAGPGNGVSSGRATPLGIPHQAAVLAALRSVEDVRNCETTSPYDMYRPVEADNDCEPSASGTNASASASTNASANASANASGAEDEVEGASGAGGAVSDENANPGGEDEEGNITFGSPMTMCVKKEYQAEYPHLPITSPRHSRHRSSNTDLIPRNVLLQRDANENSPGKASRRSIAELF